MEELDWKWNGIVREGKVERMGRRGMKRKMEGMR